ncbi:type II toxin-antitoxin system VapC family toxin [Treponema sp.]
MKTAIIDTNIVSALFKGDADCARSLSEYQTIYFSVVVIAEQLYGYAKGNRETQNTAYLENFLSKPNVKVVQCTKRTAQIYAKTRKILSDEGRPIPSNDLWIASQAIELNAILLSHDAHFGNIPLLQIHSPL